MELSVERRYNNLVTDFNALLDKCTQLTVEELNTPIAPGKWSIAQILAHINFAFSGPIAYLNHKLKEPEKIPNKNLSTWWRSFSLNIALKSDFKFKAPKGVDIVPDRLQLADIQQQWDTEKTELKKILDEFPIELKNKAVFRHPLAGRITLGQTLEFMRHHLMHHERQITRYLKNKHISANVPQKS